MPTYPEVKRFVQDVLGCSCPEYVFNEINCNNECVAFSGRKITVGGRLLIYLITMDRKSCIQEVVNTALEQGVVERDKQGFNRFRLVIVASCPDDIRSLVEKAFNRSGCIDEKTHLHVVSMSDAEGF